MTFFKYLVSQMYYQQVFQKPLFIKWNYIIKACINGEWNCLVVRFYKLGYSFLIQRRHVHKFLLEYFSIYVFCGSP